MGFFKKLKPDFFLIFLILIAAFLCYNNYTPNTYLSGWDTLHPEFNLNLYWQRITSVWQEHQGLGAPPSQSHAAEIPRMVILSFFYLFLPPNLIRYFYFFLMIILGPTGVYLLLRYIFNYLINDPRQDNHNQTTNSIAAFLGGLFYLLNLGTMQHFVVPLEMFATKFGFLGFLYLYAIKFLNEEKRKNLIIFSILTILASPMAHTATLWYVYFIGLILFLAAYSLLAKNLIKNIFKKSLLLIIITLLVNLYWLLPNLYYVANYGQQVINSKIHRLKTEEFYYYNRKYGKVSDWLILKNFLFDWYVTNNSGQTQPLLYPWSSHLKNPSILAFGYLLTFISLIGIVFVFQRKSFRLLAFLPVFFFSSFFLLSDTPGIGFISDWLRNINPLIKEILRFPFTKSSIYSIFCFSLFFAYFHQVLLNQLWSIFPQGPDDPPAVGNFFSGLYLYLFLFIIIVFTLPAFQGNFISPIVRVKIPPEYFSLFDWSKKQSKGRILLLPIHDPYGWAIYRWKLPYDGWQIYQGAGFTWFGLKQPSLNPEFNRWYPYNEQAYREFFYAIYSKNRPLLQGLLSKYNIKYILLDENVIVPGEGDKSPKLFYPEIKKLLAQLSSPPSGRQPTGHPGGVLRQTKKFGKKISLFEFLPNKNKQAVEILTNYKIINPAYRWNYIDKAYQQYKDYITDNQNPSEVDFIYPGRNLLTEEEKINEKILSIGEDSYQIILPKNQSLANGEIKIPSLVNTESEFYSEVYAKKQADKIIIDLKYLLPFIGTDRVYRQRLEFTKNRLKIFSINDKIFTLPDHLTNNEIYLGEILLSTRKENNITFYNTEKPEPLPFNLPFNLSPYLCSPAKENQIFGAQTTLDKQRLHIYGQKAKVCLDISLKGLVKIEKPGLLQLTYDYQKKKNGKTNLCLFDKNKNKCSDFYLPANQERLSSLLLKFSFDTTTASRLDEVSIENIRLNFYPQEASQSFFAQMPKFNLITKEFKLKGKFPRKKINLSPETIDPEKKDCGFKKAKFIDKQFIKEDGKTVLEYRAIDGSICDFFVFPDLSQNTGYLLGIESENISGLPLKICLEDNQSKICVLDDKLSKNKTMKTDYFIIPPYFNGQGYNLLLNNYSIGEVPTINRIRKIKIIPFPYNFFQSIRWRSEKSSGPQPADRLVKVSINQRLPFLYRAKISSTLPDNPLLVLDQAYEKNWKAFVNGQELKNHLLVNNWANGWLIDGKRCHPKGGVCNVTIIFWPQFLEFFGFGLMIITLIIIFLF